MKNKIYLLVIMLVNVMEVSGQAPDWQWAERGGGTDTEVGYKICTDANGNSYVAGEFVSVVSTFGSFTLTNADATGTSTDIFILKYNTSGNLVWAKRAGGNDTEGLYGISIDGSGNFYITGKFYSDTITFGTITLVKPFTSYNKVFLTKYDTSGSAIWARAAGGGGYDASNDVCTDPAGNAYITGLFSSDSIMFDNYTLYNTGSFDFYVAKYNSSGNVQWAKSAASSSMEYGNGIGADVFGNVFVTGSFSGDSVTFDGFTLYHSASSGNDAFVVAYNASGNVQWVKSVWANSWVNVNGISTDMFGNTNITGDFTGSAISFGSVTLTNTNSNTSDIFVAKYSAAGNVLWAKKAGGDSTDWGGGIVTDVNGNCYVTGTYNSVSVNFGSTVLLNMGGFCVGGCTDIFIAKYDLSGNELWAKSANGSYYDYSRSIGIDGAGNAYITGNYTSHPIYFGTIILYNAGGTGSSDFFIARTGNTSGIDEENSFSNSINIFPNPGNGQVNITSADVIDEIEIRDVLGQVIYKAKPLERNVALNINREGIYFVSVRAGKEMVVRKVIEIKN